MIGQAPASEIRKCQDGVIIGVAHSSSVSYFIDLENIRKRNPAIESVTIIPSVKASGHT